MAFQSFADYQKNRLHSPASQSNYKSKEKWWAAVWNGLPVEPSAKHYHAMRNAVWLYLYLLIYANRLTGKLSRRIATIAKDTGLNSRTISRWLNALKKGNYVEVKPTGRALQISITKWKSIKK